MYEPLMSGDTVRKLWVGETELYRQPLLRLDAESRRSLLGGTVSDEFIRRYAEPSALSGVVIYAFLSMACYAVPPSCACSSTRAKPRRP